MGPEGVRSTVSCGGNVGMDRESRDGQGEDDRVNDGEWNCETRKASFRKREGILHQASLFAFGHLWCSCVFLPWALASGDRECHRPTVIPVSAAVASHSFHAPAIRIVPTPPGSWPSHDPGLRARCVSAGSTSGSRGFSARSSERHSGSRSLLEEHDGGVRRGEADCTIDHGTR